MLKSNFKKAITAIIILISLTTASYFITTTNANGLDVNPSITTTKSDVTPIAPNNLIIIEAKDYNLDTTGITDTSANFQTMIDSFISGSTIQLPSGTYKFSNTVKLKDNVTFFASNDVIISGTGNNTLFSTGNNTSFSGIEFQNCSTALSVFKKIGLNVTNCRFTNNITFSAINFYGSSSSTVIDSYFYNIRKYGILIDDDSDHITIDNNNFDNPQVFGGYAKEQIGGHIYSLNGSNINVTNNIIKNSGGQGIIFGYNSTTGKGTTNSVAKNNLCEGNGQEGATIYGGKRKVTSENSLLNNTCKNNRFNQIEVWQSDNNIVKSNTVEESITGIGNLGAICLFNTTGTTVFGNNIISAGSNGIAIVAGTSNCNVSDNYIADTNRKNNVNTPEKGNGILLDWNGVGDPSHITIRSNVISSSNGTISKSGVYSTSNANHHNQIDSNTITGYKYGVHFYALSTCAE
ncbi:right-handed parallel beta-helix repeat-containing protein [Clostridium sp.]|uniref:right-handed parallel beta-helix repeat-containing protein n=1 Tax=Clostridium sp. TaxID=1506 RepID=UPI003D6CFCF9